MRAIGIRIGIVALVWASLVAWSSYYFWQVQDQSRFDFFVSPNGVISQVQYETWFRDSPVVEPGDRLLYVSGVAFQLSKIREFLETRKPGTEIDIQLKRGTEVQKVKSVLKRYSKQSVLTLFVLPLVLSFIFFGFSLGVFAQRGVLRVNRESVEVFSNLCFFLSLLFAVFFPAFTLGLSWSLAVVIPLFAVALAHLSLVYPKQKGPRWLRWSLLGACYAGAVTLIVMRLADPQWTRFSVVHDLNWPLLLVSFLVGMSSIAHTLLTSRDFWARRRARLLSLVFLVSIVGIWGVFVAFVWEGPHLSIERILGISLFFPTAFSVVFLKSNVLDLERIFRRGLHQLALLAVAIVFALLIGIGWSDWLAGSANEWMLWIAIAIGVLTLARPLAQGLEEAVHRLIRTDVKYPAVHEIYERSKRLDEFLTAFGQDVESNLAMRSLFFRFFSDPTKPWTSQNEQRWRFHDGVAERTSYWPRTGAQRVILRRGEIPIGELSFEGGDAIAFDPHHSREWFALLKNLARCVEILCLREFLSLQEGFLAVGRMQALLAHELKNPLSIIKVCSGLLKSSQVLDEEGEELIGTVQSEVDRISKALQAVFAHSGLSEQKEKVSLRSIFEEVRDRALARFPEAEIKIDGLESAEADWVVWTEKESLRQAVSNLVVNALEAGSPRVALAMEERQGRISVRVEDSGPGVPKHIELFRPFVTTKPSGTGLGLAQVKSFVDRNQGYIRVQSSPQRGSTFTLEFPPSFVFNSQQEDKQ